MKKLIRHILYIVIGSMALTTLIVQIPNPIFSDIGSKDSWISFFSSITGGILTLYGVWWTIKAQQNDKDNEYFPLPQFDLETIIVKNDKIKQKYEDMTTVDSIYYDTDEKSDKPILFLPLYSYNIQDTPVFDLSIVNISIKVHDENKHFETYTISKDKIKITNIIPVGCKVILHLNIRFDKEFSENILNNYLSYLITFNFQYKKINYDHSQRLTISFNHMTKEGNIYYPNKTQYVLFVEDIK